MSASNAQGQAGGISSSPHAHPKPAQQSDAPSGYTVEPAPSWVTASPSTEDAAAESSASMIYRVIDEQYQLGARSEAHYLHIVRVINQSAGLDAGSRIEIQFDPSYQKLVLHHLELVRAGKRLNRLDRKYPLLRRETQLERQIYDGRETLSIVLDDVRVGDEVDYAYSIHGNNPVFGDKFVALVGLGNILGPETMHQVRLLASPSRDIHYAMVHGDLQPVIRTVGGLREMVFRKDHTPRLDFEPGAPYSAFIDRWLQFSEFDDWAEVARWGTSVFPRDARGPLLDQEADAIKAQASTAPEQVLAALEFVQKDIRYFGTEIGPYTHRPASPETVLKQRFGDCKDKVALLTTLLNRIDIRATPILVSATLRGAAAQMLPSPLAFDHTIVRVDLDNESFYLDATRTEQTGTLANRQTAGLGQGLPLTSQGSSLVALPAAYGTAHLTVTDTFYFERMDGDPTLESRVVFRGDLAEAMRSVIAKQGPEVLFKQLAGPYLKLYPEAHTSAPMTVESSKDDDALTLVNHFVVPGFLSPPDGIARTAQLVPFAVTDSLGFPATESRHTPLGFQVPGIVRHTDIVDFPEDVFPNKEAAQRFEGGDAHVSLRQVTEHSRRKVEIFTELSINVDQVDPDDWPTFSKKIQELLPHLYTTVRIPAMTKLDAPEKPADTNGPANSNPPKDDKTRYLITRRSDDTKFYTSIARLNSCQIPGPPASLIIPWNLYPDESRKHNEQGTAILQLFFDPVGCVRKAAIVQSTGFYRLDNLSLEYVMTLKLQLDKFHITQTDDGQPTTRMPIEWKLTKPYDPNDPCTQGAKCADEAPPPPQPEEPGTAPQAGYIWMPGYYVYYAKTAYQWNDGHWEPARPGFHWNAPHWKHLNSKWVFVPGNWEANK